MASLNSIVNGSWFPGIEIDFDKNLIYGPYLPLLTVTVSFLYSPSSFGNLNKSRASSRVIFSSCRSLVKLAKIGFSSSSVFPIWASGPNLFLKFFLLFVSQQFH